MCYTTCQIQCQPLTLLLRYRNTHTDTSTHPIWSLACIFLCQLPQWGRPYNRLWLWCSLFILIILVETDDPRHPYLLAMIIVHILTNKDCPEFWKLDLNNHLVDTSSWITGCRGLCSKINCLSTWVATSDYISNANVLVWIPAEHPSSSFCFHTQKWIRRILSLSQL